MSLLVLARNEMLKGLKDDLTDIQLKFQDGTTSSVITETSLWGAISSGTLPQDAVVEFNVDTTTGTKNISGFKLIFTDDSSVGFDINLSQIYNYPNNGNFTFDGMSINLN